jgi:hypothetical protein
MLKAAGSTCLVALWHVFKIEQARARGKSDYAPTHMFSGKWQIGGEELISADLPYVMTRMLLRVRRHESMHADMLEDMIQVYGMLQLHVTQCYLCYTSMLVNMNQAS